jgi:hypothetical protein
MKNNFCTRSKLFAYMNNLRQKQGLLILINTKRSHMILKFSLNLNGNGPTNSGPYRTGPGWWEWKTNWQGKAQYSKKTRASALCSSQMSHYLTLDGTGTAGVRKLNIKTASCMHEAVLLSKDTLRTSFNIDGHSNTDLSSLLPVPFFDAILFSSL